MWTSKVATVGLAAVWSAACGLNTSGFGTATGSIPEGGTTESADTDVLDPSSGTTSPAADDGASGTTTDEPSTTTTTGTTAAEDDDTADDDTTGPPVDPCNPAPPVMIEVAAGDAMLNASMNLGNVASIGDYLYSESQLAGTASFTFQVECPGEYFAWAFVHDPVTGITSTGVRGDPDSYRVRFDNGSFEDWLYGCDLNDFGDSGATWAWLRATQSDVCLSPSAITASLTAGTHVFHMTNREEGNHQVSGQDIGNVAAVARVLITNDPGFSP